MARFLCGWKKDIRTSPGCDFTILEAEGEGHLAGVNLQMQGYGPGFAFLEGDEKIWVDNERFPSIVGTRTEDFFNSGWYFRHGTFAAPT